MTAIDKLRTYAKESNSELVVQTFPCYVLVKFPPSDAYSLRSGVGDTLEEASAALLKKVGR